MPDRPIDFAKARARRQAEAESDWGNLEDLVERACDDMAIAEVVGDAVLLADVCSALRQPAAPAAALRKAERLLELYDGLPSAGTPWNAASLSEVRAELDALKLFVEQRGVVDA